MLRYTIEYPSSVQDVPLTPLIDFDPVAVTFMGAAFTEHAARAAAEGQRTTNWERREVVTASGLFIARVLDRDTIMFDEDYGRSGAHSEQFEISDRLALGTMLYSGGVNPNGYDWEDEGHNSDLVFAFEARLPDGSESTEHSVRIGLREEAIGGLAVVSGSMLSTIDPELRLFDPSHYESATPDPVQREFPLR